MATAERARGEDAEDGAADQRRGDRVELKAGADAGLAADGARRAHDAGEAGHDARDRVDGEEMALDVDARDARGERIGADGVGELAVAGIAQGDMEDEGDAEKDDDGPPAGADRGEPVQV